ncbi:MAG: hypothetical protein sL5_06300 [Candidatus Mesenet longicola]|uniref:Uncharacterized protein n=1 Tax=Candidatus Mesenet longicola TaxID=1892558 RepID=A0A8J3MQK2_9RICK|nr:MAG: hypothetical protein sGL2_06300 [Candidatus Mesenet longicola]GHM59637.1 MAG: hypothetical protein sL5_06300 [Candidatus Mesenet longicola]
MQSSNSDQTALEQIIQSIINFNSEEIEYARAEFAR